MKLMASERLSVSIRGIRGQQKPTVNSHPGLLERKQVGPSVRLAIAVFQALDEASLGSTLPIVKSAPKNVATKRASVRKPRKRLVRDKSRLRDGFAPELCGIVTGPTDLSLREGFGSA